VTALERSSVALAIERARGALLAFAADGFAEAAHTLAFPRSQGFDVASDEQTGDVFARAILASTLAEQPREAGDDVDAVVAREIEHLLAVRRIAAPGGWSYFPELGELPSDADDLAEVLRAFVLAGRPELAEAYVTEPLRVLFEECSVQPGVFETWIVPRRRSALHERQAWWIAAAWGAGPDVDVIANLLHAVWSYDRVQHSHVLTGGADYVASRRTADGLWDASWYHGVCYPAFVAVRFLAAMERDEPVAAACSALLARRNADGAWGTGPRSDPLATAFALLALAHGGHADDVERAIRVLVAAQGPDGAWDAVPWIKMELGRADGAVHTVLSYGSRTITTAYALRALRSVEARLAR
jgi:hypothetical protein